MGRGDIKSKRGKIANGSFGKKRKQRVKKENAVTTPAPKTKKVKSENSVMDGETPVVKKTKKTTKKTKEVSSEE